jgi:hypothetical protein
LFNRSSTGTCSTFDSGCRSRTNSRPRGPSRRPKCSRAHTRTSSSRSEMRRRENRTGAVQRRGGRLRRQGSRATGREGSGLMAMMLRNGTSTRRSGTAVTERAKKEGGR